MEDIEFFITILNYTAGAIFVFFWFPQIIRVYNNKSAKDLSIKSLIINVFGLILSIIYGFYFEQYSYAIPLSIELIFNILLVSQKIYYDNYYIIIIDNENDSNKKIDK